MKRAFHLVVPVVVILAMVLGFLPVQTVQAVSSNVVISQVYGGGGNAGGVYTNDFVELYNLGSTTISLSGWSIQYTSATGTGNFGSSTTQITPLSGSIAPGQYILVQEAAGANVQAALPTPDITDGSPINMSGTGGKVALVNTTVPLGCNGGSTPCSPAQLAPIVDLVGWGSANFYEGSAPAPATANATAVIRNGGGCAETDNNSADFAVAAPNPRNSASPTHNCAAPTNPSAIGTATPNSPFVGDVVLLTLAVIPGANPTSTGLAATCDLSSIGGSASQDFYDDGTSGDVAAADNTFSFAATIPSGTTGGTKNLACTITDAEARTGSATIGLTVTVILPIGTVQGAVTDTTDGATFRSPYAPASGNGTGQKVTVQGVIFENAIQPASFGAYYGFFIQNTASTADADPTTSDGLYVFMSTKTTVSGPDGPYTPTVGDEVIVSGTISEYYNMTELSNPVLVKPIVHSGVDLEAELAPIVVEPPAGLQEANRYWERMESMRVQIPAESIVLGGRNVFSPPDGEVWVATPTSTVALRSDPYTRRAFRDAHPLDDNYNSTNWDGNGYRILMGSWGIKADAADSTLLIDPARTFDTVTNAPVGALNYTFSKYRVEITEQPTYLEGVDPSANTPVQPIQDRTTSYSIVDYNLENLYDYRNNPFSGCDFTGDSGCPKVAPFLAAVNSPYDYIPASDAAYQARLADIATQIINDLYEPDILMLQEVENQDICSLSDGVLVCGTTDNADGKPDVLQELALKIADMGGATYDAAFDRNSSDLRGIAPAFLYRSDRVELLPADGDSVLGTAPAIAYPGAGVPANADVSNPKTLNAVLPAGISACETSWVFPRAPDVALFRIYSESVGVGNYADVYAINNHFKSGPDTCVAHRTEQAKYNAALVSYIQNSKPGARVVVGGDLNVYPRPDDTAYAASDQLGSLYDSSIGLKNLWEVLLAEAPESAYSYVYLGMAQTLDQMFINPPLLADLQQFRIAHINSDFPADYSDDIARGTSDHDPNVATFLINQPPTVVSGGPYVVKKGDPLTLSASGSDPESSPLTFAWDLDNDGVFETEGQSIVYPTDVAAYQPVSVQVTDNGGLTAVAATYIAIFDPQQGGFVTGSGWFTSPADGYKAKFDVMAKYKKGQLAPEGATQLILRDGLTFTSTAYAWMVVSGNTAVLQGTGSMNGTGEFSFMISETDNSPDKIQIQIWDASGVVYDTVAPVDIEGGNISIK